MDFALIGADNEGYFIEVNSFGAHYAAGSALFNWTIDYDQINGLKNCIELRFCNTVE